jgi:hypothetical protein
MQTTSSGILIAACSLCLAATAFALEAGKAAGTATVDGTTAPLSFATETRKENLFDDKKQDVVIVLTDKPLGATLPDDEIALSMRARAGDFAAYALRLDGGRLVNVTVSREGLGGLVILPGAWFQYARGQGGVGTLKLARRDDEGHSYAIDVEFAAAPYRKPRPGAAPAAPPPQVTPSPPPPRATTSNIDRTQATALLIQALMQRDEHRALEIVKLGVDPNGRDQAGIPVLNWAVMMCQPAVVKALVDARADLQHERAPGLTILTEAGACPDAARILRAAGAR